MTIDKSKLVMGISPTLQPVDDPENFFWQQTEMDLEKDIKEKKKELTEWRKDKSKEKDVISMLEEELQNLEMRLEVLTNSVDNFERLKERYKHDKTILEQIIKDWHDYNNSLYEDWLRLQGIFVDSFLDRNEEEEEEWWKEQDRLRRQQEIIQEEIRRRFAKLLEE